MEKNGKKYDIKEQRRKRMNIKDNFPLTLIIIFLLKTLIKLPYMHIHTRIHKYIHT